MRFLIISYLCKTLLSFKKHYFLSNKFRQQADMLWKIGRYLKMPKINVKIINRTHEWKKLNILFHIIKICIYNISPLNYDL